MVSMFCCCRFFFFFKQKTAYEMRISDWSSDVCSSDLGYQQHALLRIQIAAVGCKALDAVFHDRVAAAFDLYFGAFGKLRSGPVVLPREIGSASCRDRVCQYV